jgi:hypothetical protein
MPPRQVEKPPLKQGNHQRVDSVEMPPRGGGKLFSTKPLNAGRQKISGGSSGKLYANDVRNSNRPYQPPILHQSFNAGSIFNSSYQSNRHTGGPIRNERIPVSVARGTPYNIPHPQAFTNSRVHVPAPALTHHQRFPVGSTTNTARNVGGRSFTSPNSFSSNGHVNSSDGFERMRIIVSDDSDSVTINKNYSESSLDIQKRLEALEEKQQILLKELEANKKGLQKKDLEIESLSQTIENQKSKLNKRDETRYSNNNNNSQNDQYNYKVINHRSNHEDDDGDETHDTTTFVGTGSINAMFAKARNQNRPKEQ